MQEHAQPGIRPGAPAPGGGRGMTLWTDFLARLMLGVSLSGPAVAARAEDALASQPPAEIGDPAPDRQAAPRPLAEDAGDPVARC